MLSTGVHETGAHLVPLLNFAKSNILEGDDNPETLLKAANYSFHLDRDPNTSIDAQQHHFSLMEGKPSSAYSGMVEELQCQLSGDELKDFNEDVEAEILVPEDER